jgi:hypothetical protein
MCSCSQLVMLQICSNVKVEWNLFHFLKNSHFTQVTPTARRGGGNLSSTVGPACIPYLIQDTGIPSENDWYCNKVGRAPGSQQLASCRADSVNRLSAWDGEWHRSRRPLVGVDAPKPCVLSTVQNLVGRPKFGPSQNRIFTGFLWIQNFATTFCNIFVNISICYNIVQKTRNSCSVSLYCLTCFL